MPKGFNSRRSQKHSLKMNRKSQKTKTRNQSRYSSKLSKNKKLKQLKQATYKQKQQKEIIEDYKDYLLDNTPDGTGFSDINKRHLKRSFNLATRYWNKGNYMKATNYYVLAFLIGSFMLNRKKTLLKTYGTTEGIGKNSIRSLSTFGPQSLSMSVTGRISNTGKDLKSAAQNKADKVLDIYKSGKNLQKHVREYQNNRALPTVDVTEFFEYVKLVSKIRM